ncbi:MAG: add, partial [Pseudonocardiales bacterium]|nr:add [Pseudonocardiales bacterium]
MPSLDQLPKAHLHVHLESAIRWSTLREIGAANGVDVPEHLNGRTVRFDGFRDFADQNGLVRRCLRRAADFERVAYEFCLDEAANGTRYAELTVSAASHGERLGQLEMPLEAVLRGLAAGAADCGLQTRVLLDHSRRRSVDRARHTLELARAYDEVIGIGAAGDEAYPLAPFAEVWDAARAAGLKLVHHAGEAGGPSSIREAIAVGHADRLGHGIRILSDGSLVDEVRARGIALEVCPSSNVALGYAQSVPAHPLAGLRGAGLVVTINTDIPMLLGIGLAE